MNRLKSLRRFKGQIVDGLEKSVRIKAIDKIVNSQEVKQMGVMEEIEVIENIQGIEQI